MKCPKCDYLGFETGDRCKNCGYDFSLSPAPAEADGLTDELVLDLPPRAPAAKTALPLFTLPSTDDDEPLIKLPAAPRPPLAVRKTPELPRLRAVKTVRRAEVEPVLAFAEEGASDLDLQLRDPEEVEPARRPAPRPLAAVVAAAPSSAGARLGAAALDHVILLAVDAAVVYFTLRMAALAPGEWALLPPVPLATFLVLLKFAYFFAFTAVGGQTIGKMALNIRVIADGDGVLDPARAVRRTLAGLLSSIALGLGFVPALFGDRRALHDRLARTRVVALRSA